MCLEDLLAGTITTNDGIHHIPALNTSLSDKFQLACIIQQIDIADGGEKAATAQTSSSRRNLRRIDFSLIDHIKRVKGLRLHVKPLLVIQMVGAGHFNKQGLRRL
jgi:hypothetical protein